MPTAPIQYRTYRDYAGFIVRGNIPVPIPDSNAPHIVRAAYLLSQMEAANYGTVQSYDGCGISAGPLHAIAVSPSTKKQGALWGLLANIFEQVEPGDDNAVDELRAFFKNRGVVVTQNGALVYRENGRKVGGEDIRSILFSSPNGVTPSSGPAHIVAKATVMRFHRAFSSPSTFRAQEAFTIKWLMSGRQEIEANAYSKYAKTPLRPADVSNFLSSATQQDLGQPLDLAMCIYHAFTVNGPSPAATALGQAMVHLRSAPIAFAKTLVRRLGTSSYGRWKDTTDGNNRYDKTRKAVLRLPYWDHQLVDELMPENL